MIGSLNGTTAETWLKFAKLIEQAGADALELNYVQSRHRSRVSRRRPSSRAARRWSRNLKRALKIPLAVKLSPFFTAFGNVARQLDEAGADGLVLFNRFYQPDIDIRP